MDLSMAERKRKLEAEEIPFVEARQMVTIDENSTPEHSIYYVESFTSSLAYTVEADGINNNVIECNCPDRAKRIHNCKHMFLVARLFNYGVQVDDFRMKQQLAREINGQIRELNYMLEDHLEYTSIGSLEATLEALQSINCGLYDEPEC